MESLQASRQYWWVPLIWGIVGVLFGLMTLFWPGRTLFILIYLFGIFLIVDGIMAAVTAFQERELSSAWWVLLAAGIIGIILGIAILVWPRITALVLLYLVAMWAIITGIFEVAAGFGMQRPESRGWGIVVAGILSIILGIVLFAVSPVVGLLSIAWVIGLYAIIYGIVLIARSFQLRSRPTPAF
jgi:uncharacterized membrane protein HdeD (DUF308 family)